MAAKDGTYYHLTLKKIVMATRIVRYQCIDEIGQRATFTVDKKGKQNSPSFKSYYDLLQWADQPHNYAFKAEMIESNKGRYTVGELGGTP